MSSEFINFNKIDEVKFNTCKHRSLEEIIEVKKTCCSSMTIKGYKCLLLQHFPLNSMICKECQKFEIKDNVQETI
ncbi:MAG: hypothetical protein AABY22_26095 [Nanoarchaeota archaeon]